MDTTELEILKEQVSAYNLMDAIVEAMAVRTKGGVATTTVYKALREGGKTPLLRLILATTQEMVHQHEAKFKNVEPVEIESKRLEISAA